MGDETNSPAEPTPQGAAWSRARTRAVEPRWRRFVERSIDELRRRVRPADSARTSRRSRSRWAAGFFLEENVGDPFRHEAIAEFVHVAAVVDVDGVGDGLVHGAEIEGRDALGATHRPDRARDRSSRHPRRRGKRVPRSRDPPVHRQRRRASWRQRSSTDRAHPRRHPSSRTVVYRTKVSDSSVVRP